MTAKTCPACGEQLQGQVYLGSEGFILTMQGLIEQQPRLDDIRRVQRRALQRALADFAQKHPRDDAIAVAYLSGQYTMAAIADHFGVHYTTVGRLVKAHESSQRNGM